MSSKRVGQYRNKEQNTCIYSGKQTIELNKTEMLNIKDVNSTTYTKICEL
jgi:hypothetical protein